MEIEEKIIAKKKAIEIYKESGIFIKKEEFEKLEITDFGLSDFYNIGITVLIYVNTMRVCAKEISLLPYQICPQHRHPNKVKILGKEEIFRCRWGEVYLYIEGPITEKIKAKIPDKYKDKFTVFNEIILKPGDQCRLEPNISHWFQGGPEGAVLSEFSSHSDDKSDIFFDENVNRKPIDNLDIFKI